MKSAESRDEEATKKVQVIREALKKLCEALRIDGHGSVSPLTQEELIEAIVREQAIVDKETP